MVSGGLLRMKIDGINGIDGIPLLGGMETVSGCFDEIG